MGGFGAKSRGGKLYMDSFLLEGIGTPDGTQDGLSEPKAGPQWH